MAELISFINQYWPETAIAIGIFLAVLLAGYIVERILLTLLKRLSTRNKVKLEGWVYSAFRWTYAIFLFALAVNLSLRFSPLSEYVAGYIDLILVVLTTFVITLLVANLSSWFIRRLINRPDSKLPVNSIMENIVRTVIITIGALIILGQLQVEIGPVLTTLGVGGLAIGLALQPTLINFFAGMQIISDQAVKKGDFIELDSNTRGYVVDIGWRSTRLRTPFNTLIVLPNSRLSEAVITNFHGTNNKLGFILYYGVSYGSDLEKVERLAVSVAQEVIDESDAAEKSTSPWFGFEEFGDSNITFWLWVNAKNRLASFKMKSELIKRLHNRFAEEGIVHNYPVRLNHPLREAVIPSKLTDETTLPRDI